MMDVRRSRHWRPWSCARGDRGGSSGLQPLGPRLRIQRLEIDHDMVILDPRAHGHRASRRSRCPGDRDRPFFPHGCRFHRSSDRLPRTLPAVPGHRSRRGEGFERATPRRTVRLDGRIGTRGQGLVGSGITGAPRTVSGRGSIGTVGGHGIGVQQHAVHECSTVANDGSLASRGGLERWPCAGWRSGRCQRLPARRCEGAARPRHSSTLYRNQRG